MRELVLSMECEEGGETLERSVYLAPLTTEKLRFWWSRLNQFPTLFGRHINGVDDFITTFITVQSDGEIVPKGIVWEVDDVGLIYMTNIYPGYQATGHFTFWDRRIRGREPLIREMVRYAFENYGFHRIVAEVPLYAPPTIAAARRIGFKREGRLRSAAWYNGSWFDCYIFSILEGELNGIPQA